MIVVALLFALASDPAAAPAHDRAYWRSIIEHDFQPPAGASVPDLARELSSMLGDRDPELRDETVYSILTNWIYRKHIVDGPLLVELEKSWTANLTREIGSTSGDAVLLRSFSALMLSVVAARDNADPFLDAAQFRGLLDAVLAYLHDEKDIRGYDASAGWMHSAAHTADLLKFLARSRYMTRDDQARILDAIAAKLANAGAVFGYGEDERFARAVLSIVNRTDFDPAAFDAWVVRATPGAMSERPGQSELAARQNVKNVFSKLFVLVSTAPKQTDATQAARASLAKPLEKMY
jgi:hypothetical protein